MIQFIIGITLIALLIEYPSILFLAMIISICIYTYTKRPDLFAKLGIRIPTEYKTEEADDLPAGRKDFETSAERMAREEVDLEKRMKPGYKDDPEWKEKAENLGKMVARNEEIAEKELKLEMLKEAERYAVAGEWSKVDAIEQELREMAAN